MVSSELEEGPSDVELIPKTLPVDGAAVRADYSLRELGAAVLPFDSAELGGFSEADAEKMLSGDASFQVGALDFFIAEAMRLDSEWPGMKEERRTRLADWVALPDWERGRHHGVARSKRRKKTWSEKGVDFLLCGIRCRVVVHLHEDSDCPRMFTVPEYCRLRGCPRCGEKQANDFYNKWLPRLLGVVKYHPKGARDGKSGYEFYHLTLTSKKPETRPSPGEARLLWDSFLKKVGRFCRAFYPGSLGKSELFPALEGCGSLSQGEVGRKKDGTANWNQHAHVIAYGPWHRVKKMKAFWTELSGASGYGVEIQRLGNDPAEISRTLRHMFKYYKKPFSYDPKTYVETLVGMSGVRLRRATGIFYRDRRGSDWADRVADWESWAREELEALGRIPERVLKCFECGGVLVPDYSRGILWRAQALALGCEDHGMARKNRGPPSWALSDREDGADEVVGG